MKTCWTSRKKYLTKENPLFRKNGGLAALQESSKFDAQIKKRRDNFSDLYTREKVSLKLRVSKCHCRLFLRKLKLKDYVKSLMNRKKMSPKHTVKFSNHFLMVIGFYSHFIIKSFFSHCLKKWSKNDQRVFNKYSKKDYKMVKKWSKMVKDGQKWS